MNDLNVLAGYLEHAGLDSERETLDEAAGEIEDVQLMLQCLA